MLVKESIIIQVKKEVIKVTDIAELEEIRKKIDKEIDELYSLSSVIYSLKTVIEYFQKKGKSI